MTAQKSVKDVAARLAKHGLYVGPLKPSTKNPGSRLGKGWQEKTSNDPKQVREWFREHPDDGLFLHVGRSGLIVFDLDTEDGLESLPVEIADALRQGLFQRSRGTGDRGHYVFRTSEDFGNSAGGFSPWGDVRGKNGVIVLAPSLHPDTGKPYRHVRGDWGEVPELPNVLRSLLRVGGHTQQPALAHDELQELLASLVTGTDSDLLNERCTEFRAQVEAGMARHEALLHVALRIVRDSKEGRYALTSAIERLREEFAATFKTAFPGKRSAPAADEFDGVVLWAAAQQTPVEAANDLFDRTEVLRMVRRYAQEYSVAPLGLLTVGIARALACLPPCYVLPAVVGSAAPLNFFFALVGPSGAGKGATEELADQVFPMPQSVRQDLHIGRPGSSEGLAKMYGSLKNEKDEDGQKRLVAAFSHTRVLASLPEVDSLDALMGRDGSLLSSTLREVWSGSRIGFDYAHAHTKFVVGSKRFRFCMLVGVQPGRADAILRGQEGGLPQRFLWINIIIPPGTYRPPMNDRSDLSPVVLPEVEDEQFRTRTWLGAMQSNAESSDLVEVSIPAEVRAQILRARELAVQGLASDSEGHRILVQEKVAMGFAVLHGRTDGFDLEHWEMADIVLRASDDTLAGMKRDLALQRSRAKAKDAEETGRLRHRRSEAQQRALTDTVKKRVLERIDGSDDGEASWSGINRALSPRQREVLDIAVDELKAEHVIAVRSTKARNGQRNRFLTRQR